MKRLHCLGGDKICHFTTRGCFEFSFFFTLYKLLLSNLECRRNSKLPTLSIKSLHFASRSILVQEHTCTHRRCALCFALLK